MCLDNIATIQKRHLAVGLDPHLVPCVRRNDIQRRDVQPELARLCEFAQASAQREQRVARNGSGEVGQRGPHVVDARVLDAEDVWVLRVIDEVLKGLAGVIGELFEESFCLGFGEWAHLDCRVHSGIAEDLLLVTLIDCRQFLCGVFGSKFFEIGKLRLPSPQLHDFRLSRSTNSSSGFSSLILYRMI